MEGKNILIVGVGGQGTLLASRIMGQVASDAGYDVKVSEVHGMSQRGGSVVTYVRYGKEVHSPYIDLGGADMIIAFESLEAARYVPYLKKGGVILANHLEIDPMPVITGQAVYPANIEEQISVAGIPLKTIHGMELATQAGTPKAVNVVLMGALSHFLDFTEEQWQKALETTVPAKFLEMNKKAFALGADAVK